MTIEKYILDTNIVSYLYEDNSLQSSSVKEYLLKLPDGCEVYVSILAHNAILVSSDGIFEQIQKIHPELLIENWSAKKVETP